jgi:energy-coupling factor transport system substrate-specific component
MRTGHRARRTLPSVPTDPRALPLSRRTGVALAVASATGLLAFTWPLLVTHGAGLSDATQAPLVLAVVLVGVLAVVLAALADGGLDAKGVAVLGLLSAVGAVVRPLSAGTAGVELVFVVIVLGARVLGPGFGFALGSTTILTSALLTGGVGPWLPFQMLAASWVGLGAGLLPRRLRGGLEVAVVAAYGAVAALAFGLLMNLAFWPFQLGGATALSFVAGAPVAENLQRFALYTATTSLGWDVGRAVTTVVGVALLGRPLLHALRRTATRAAFAPAARHLPVTATAGSTAGATAGSSGTGTGAAAAPARPSR